MSSLLFGLLENPEFPEGVYWRRDYVNANQTVFQQGTQERDVYLILSGSVRIVANLDVDEQRRIKPGFSELSQGDLFGELALFDDEPRSATVVAVTDVELAVVDGVALLQFLDARPAIGYPIIKELIATLVFRLRKANQKIFSLFAWGLKSHGIDEYL